MDSAARIEQMVRLVPARSDVPEAQAMVDGTAKENIASTLSRGNWRFPWGNHGFEELGLDPAMWSLDVTSKPPVHSESGRSATAPGT